MKAVTDSRLGTPEDLKEAIRRSLEHVLPGVQFERNSPDVRDVHDIIQDRLSQSFQAAMCSGSKESRDRMMELWYSIFPKKKLDG